MRLSSSTVVGTKLQQQQQQRHKQQQHKQQPKQKQLIKMQLSCNCTHDDLRVVRVQI